MKQVELPCMSFEMIKILTGNLGIQIEALLKDTSCQISEEDINLNFLIDVIIEQRKFETW